MYTLEQWLLDKLDKAWNPTGEGFPGAVFLFGGIALLLSTFLCGIIGMEREKRGRSAGLRTHLLVGVGSCIVMIISIYGFPAVFGGHRDVARLAAQVITGVGFLGAGAIIHRNSGIKGLTTAGTIWIVMAIGLACGSFNFILAFVATILIVIVLTAFKKVEVRLNRKKPTVILTAPVGEPVLDKILNVSKAFDCSIQGLSTELVSDGSMKFIEVTFQAVFSSAEDRVNEYVSTLERETHALSVQLLAHR